jgi:cytochrome c-type biogenesis protein CcmH
MTPLLQLPFAIGTVATSGRSRPIGFRATTDNTSAPSRPASLGLPGAMSVATLAAVVIAAAGGAWIGNADSAGAKPIAKPVASLLGTQAAGPASAREAGADLIARASEMTELSRAEAQVSTLVVGLAERLKARPNDADGWQTLGRSYAALGRHAQAITAFKAAVRLRPEDATLLAEYAFSAAVTDPRGATGEAPRLVARALQIDPRNAKALALAGTLAVDRKDYQGAVVLWEQWGQVEPADTPLGRQVRTSILQARQLAGLSGPAIPVAVTSGSAPSQLHETTW